MPRKIAFMDIDTQYDFVNPAGRLYVPGAEKLIPNLKRLFGFAEKNKIPIISSLDTHVKNDPEFKNFPPHCIKGSKGHKKIKETLTLKTKQVLVTKYTIDIFSNAKIKSILKSYWSVYVFGVALDYCVKAACLGLLELGIKTYLVTDATKAVSDKGRVKTLSLLKKKGVTLLTVDTLVKKIKREGNK